MGSFLGKAMDENLKKNQEFMAEMQKVQLERQIQMQNLMRERQMAMQIARSRELLYWFGSFYAIATIGMLAGYKRTRTPGVLAPILPLTFILAYQADMSYGSKVNRIRAEAENIMQFEEGLLQLPCGIPTSAAIDQARNQEKDEERTLKSK